MVTSSPFVKSLKPLLYCALLAGFTSVAHAELSTAEQMQVDKLKSEKADKDLVYQAFFGDSEVVQKLIAGGANPNASNENGVPALALAAQRKTPEGLEVVKALLASGANKDELDRNGQSPLFHAARVGNLPSVTMLLEVGADYYLTDKTGNIARNVAYSEGHDEVYKAMDAFVNQKREAVLKEYTDQNEKAKQRNEALKAAQEAAALAAANKKAQDAPKPTKEITIIPTDDQRTDFVQTIFDLAFSSCAYQYWYLASSYQLKTELTNEALFSAMEKYKKVADGAAQLLVKDFAAKPEYANQIIKPSQKEIANVLNKMGSNITRKSNGVGSAKDMEQRCNEIGARITLLASPEPPKVTKIVPVEPEEASPSETSDSPESAADPATAPPSAPAGEEGKTGDKSPPQESL